MSMTPNNPFEDPQDDQGYAQSPAPRKSNSGCLIGCSIAAVLGLLVCCGGGVLVWRGGSEMVAGFVNSTLSTEYQRQLADNPVIVEQIGEIESLEFDFAKTFDEAQKAGERGDNPKLVFQIEGSKGSGTLMIQQDDGDDLGIKSATLVMPDGTSHQIDVATGASEDLEIDLSEMFDTGDLDTGEVVVPESTEATPTVPESTVPESTEGTPAVPEPTVPESTEIEKNESRPLS